MAPAVTLDTSSDFSFPVSKPMAATKANVTVQRTLLLSPPSLSAHPELLNQVLEAHDRSATDIQMLDRLSLNLVSLPPSTYDVIIILTDADSTRTESHRLLNRSILSAVITSLKPGGTIKSQDGTFASLDNAGERQEAILSGLVIEGTVVTKPASTAAAAVPLRFGRNKAQGGAASTTLALGTGAPSINANGKRENGDVPAVAAKPNGVGFVDFSDDFDDPLEDSDDELIDEDTLLEEGDLTRTIVQRMLHSIFPNICLSDN